MTDPRATGAPELRAASAVQAGHGAGALLREARTAQGLHLAVLAAQIKVPPQKLEALEQDRLDQLPDLAFARALAQTVCRVLKIDPQPVLERLPSGTPRGLERMEGGLNEPFREQVLRHESADGSFLSSPAVWAPLLLVAAAVALMFAPIDTPRVRDWFDGVRQFVAGRGGDAAPSGIVTTETTAGGVTTTIVETPISAGAAGTPEIVPPASGASGTAEAPTPPAAGTSPEPAAAPAAAGAVSGTAAASELTLSATAESWVEVVDAAGKTLLYRSLKAGESVGVDGTPPLKLRIGNARATQVSFRGQPVDVAAATKGNIARLELK